MDTDRIFGNNASQEYRLPARERESHSRVGQAVAYAFIGVLYTMLAVHLAVQLSSSQSVQSFAAVLIPGGSAAFCFGYAIYLAIFAL